MELLVIFAVLAGGCTGLGFVLAKLDVLTENRKKSNYPTKEEYEKNIQEIQEKELESDRYKEIYSFLEKNYWNRQNIKLEEALFKIVGTYGIEEEMFDKKYEYIKEKRLERFEQLISFMASLNEEQIDSNIYLKTVKLFLETSELDCREIIKKLQEKRKKFKDKINHINLQTPISEERQKSFPTRLSYKKCIPYYEPSKQLKSSINLLDEKHEYVYDDYNEYVININNLAQDIYFLQMWNCLSDYPETINNYFFQISDKNEPLFISYFCINQIVNNTKEISESAKYNGMIFREYLEKAKEELNNQRNKYLSRKFK